MNRRPIQRWILAPLAVFGAFLIAGIAGAFATGALGFWSLPGAGFCAAPAVVLSAYFAAPKSRRLLCAGCAFVIGAVAAWVLLEPAWYPESYGAPRAYQRTYLPFIATCIGGVVGLVAIGVFRSRWPQWPTTSR